MKETINIPVKLMDTSDSEFEESDSDIISEPSGSDVEFIDELENSLENISSPIATKKTSNVKTPKGVKTSHSTSKRKNEKELQKKIENCNLNGNMASEVVKNSYGGSTNNEKKNEDLTSTPRIKVSRVSKEHSSPRHTGLTPMLSSLGQKWLEPFDLGNSVNTETGKNLDNSRSSTRIMDIQKELDKSEPSALLKVLEMESKRSQVKQGLQKALSLNEKNENNISDSVKDVAFKIEEALKDRFAVSVSYQNHYETLTRQICKNKTLKKALLDGVVLPNVVVKMKKEELMDYGVEKEVTKEGNNMAGTIKKLRSEDFSIFEMMVSSEDGLSPDSIGEFSDAEELESEHQYAHEKFDIENV